MAAGTAKTIRAVFPPKRVEILALRFILPRRVTSIPGETTQGLWRAAVLEVVEDCEGDSYRAVYTVRLAEAVYVLHAVQEEIEARNQKTPKHEIDLLKQRRNKLKSIIVYDNKVGKEIPNETCR